MNEDIILIMIIICLVCAVVLFFLAVFLYFHLKISETLKECSSKEFRKLKTIDALSENKENNAINNKNKITNKTTNNMNTEIIIETDEIKNSYFYIIEKMIEIHTDEKILE